MSDFSIPPKRPVSAASNSGGSKTVVLALIGVGFLGLVAAATAIAVVILNSQDPKERVAQLPPTTGAKVTPSPTPNLISDPPKTPVPNTPANTDTAIKQSPKNPPFPMEDAAAAKGPPRITGMKKFDKHTGLVQSLSLSPSQRRFLSAGVGGVIEWDIVSGESFVRHEFKTPASAAAYLPGAKLAAVADEAGVLILELAANSVKSTLKMPKGNLSCLAVEPNGSHVLTGANDGAIRRWEVAGGTNEQTIELGDGITVVSLAVDAGGKMVAAGLSDGSVGVWELPGGEAKWREKRHTGGVLSVSFDSVSKKLASCGADGIQVCDVEKGGNAFKLPGHPDGTMSVAFVGQDAGLASAGRDKSVRFWDLELKQPIRSLVVPAAVHGLLLAPNDAFVIAAGGGGMVQLLPMPKLDLEIVAKSEPPPMKASIPNAASLNQAVNDLKTNYRDALASRVAAEQKALADRWLLRASAAEVSPPLRMAYFRQAIAILVKQNQAAATFKAIDELDRWFEIDELAETVALLDGFVKTIPATGQKDLIDRGIAVLRKADAESRADVAASLVDLLTRAAEKSKAVDLTQRVAQAKAVHEQQNKEKSEFAALEAKLKSTPDDKEANRAIGLLLAARNRWTDALAHLTKGDDPALARLAERDRAEPKEPRTRSDLGLAWADAANKSTEWKTPFYTRSKHWLELAQVGLVGEEKSKVILKLGEISAHLSAMKPVDKDPPMTAGNPTTKPNEGPKKPADIARRNFDTLKNEAIYKSQWKPDGAVRVESNGVRLQSGESKLESRFLLVDNWRVEIVMEHDGRESSAEVNGQTIPLRVGPRPGALIIERKGKKIIYTRSQSPTRFTPPVIIDLPEANQSPSILAVKMAGMITSPVLPEGTLVRAINITGTVRMKAENEPETSPKPAN